MANERTIFSQAQQCLKSFEELMGTDKYLLYSQSERDASEARRIKKRFEKWCNTLGANVEGQYSLDERLRDASKVKNLVLNCLDGIEDVVRDEIKDFQNPTKVPDPKRQESSTSPSRETRALQRLLSTATLGNTLSTADAMIDVLFRVTVAIRRELSADRYEKAQCIQHPEEDLFRERDGEQMDDLFSDLSPDLKERLVSASLQRRRLLQYTKDYREKFIANLTKEVPLDGSNSFETYNKTQPQDQDPDSISMISRVSSSFSTSGILGDRTPFSDTSSIASSTNTASTSWHYRVPPFPDENENGYRICIACYLLLDLPNQRVWESHILKDIRPYVCTFTDCSIDQNKLYSSRQAWFEHELTYHRRLWYCPFDCAKVYSSLKDFEGHVYDNHNASGETSVVSIQKASRGREVPQDTEVKCPFCPKVRSHKKIKSHIGQHQAQIALMALSSMRDIEPEYEAADSDDELKHVREERSNSFTQQGESLQPDTESHTRPSVDTVPDTSSSSQPASSAQSPQSVSPNLIPIPRTIYANEEEDKLIARFNAESHSSELRRASVSTFAEAQPTKTKGPRVMRSQPSGLHPLLWIMMQDFIHSWPGAFALGQVLRHPRDPHGYLPPDRLLKPTDSTETLNRDVVIQTSKSSEFSVWPRSRNIVTDVEISAEKLVSFTFTPSQAYIRQLMEIPEVVELGVTQLSSNRIYLVVGLRVVSNCRVRKRERKMSSNTVELSAGYANASVKVGAGAERGEETTTEQFVEGPVIFAYSLVEIKKSWVGNIITTGYEKGDLR